MRIMNKNVGRVWVEVTQRLYRNFLQSTYKCISEAVVCGKSIGFILMLPGKYIHDKAKNNGYWLVK